MQFKNCTQMWVIFSLPKLLLPKKYGMLLRYQTLSSSKSSVYCIFLICYGLFKNRLEQILIGVAITQDVGTLKDV